MEPETDEQGVVLVVAPQPVGYLAGILERLKVLGPPPPRGERCRVSDPGGFRQEP